MVLEVCFRLKKYAQHEKKCIVFFRSFSLEFFSGKFGEIWAKIPRILKNFLPPTPMFKRTVFSYLNVQALVPGVCNRCLIALVDISDVCSFFFK